MMPNVPEAFSDAELRMAALAVATETACTGATTGGVLFAAEQVYRFLTGWTVVAIDGQIKLVVEEATTRH